MSLRAGANSANNHSLPVLMVTGLQKEARIAEGPGMTVICASSNPRQLRGMMRSFDARSISGIISFGVAGGLDPSLHAGDIVLASEIIASDTRWSTDPVLLDYLVGPARDAGHRVVRGPLAGVEQVVITQAAKLALRAATGAVAVDMESHIAAGFAAENRLRFAALRVVSDPASRALPALAVDALKPDGNVDIWKVMRGIARNPGAIPALIAAGRDFNRALRSLGGCRSLLADGRGGLVGTDL